MLQCWLYSNCRVAWTAAIVAILGSADGCAIFDHQHWNLDRYRDERTVDIEHRLERTEPIVPNPF